MLEDGTDEGMEGMEGTKQGFMVFLAHLPYEVRNVWTTLTSRVFILDCNQNPTFGRCLKKVHLLVEFTLT